jgi:hypothetical protein
MSKRRQILIAINSVAVGAVAGAAIGFLVSGDPDSRAIWFTVGMSSIAAVIPTTPEYKVREHFVLVGLVGAVFIAVCLIGSSLG